MKYMQEKIINQESIELNNEAKKNSGQINFNDILKIKNIEHYKLLAFLIVEDSISNPQVHEFYNKFSKAINDNQNVAIAKLKMIANLIAEKKIYFDCVLEILIDSINVILDDKKINDDEKITFLEKMNNEFIFIATFKNEIGRVYGKEERMIKAISRLIQLITPDKNDIAEGHNFLLQTKNEIYIKLQNFLQFHLGRGREMFEKMISKNEHNIFIINKEMLLDHNKDNLTQEGGKNIQKALNLLNEEKLIIKNKVEFILIIIATKSYEIAIPLILGIINYSMPHLPYLEIEERFADAKNNFQDLYLAELKNAKKNFEISKLGQKAKVFFNHSKEEIDTTNDQLKATFNLIKSNYTE
jgi:predicted RNA-binding protein YlqC (UPF0109 family)/ribosomal 50S subunit-recycling heat shock protein